MKKKIRELKQEIGQLIGQIRRFNQGLMEEQAQRKQGPPAKKLKKTVHHSTLTAHR